MILVKLTLVMNEVYYHAGVDGDNKVMMMLMVMAALNMVMVVMSIMVIMR